MPFGTCRSAEYLLLYLFYIMTSFKLSVHKKYKYFSLALVLILFGIIGIGLSTLTDEQSSENKPTNTENILNSSLEPSIEFLENDNSFDSGRAE
jgi:hypothetical protein